MGDYTAVFDFQSLIRQRYGLERRVVSVPVRELTDLLSSVDLRASEGGVGSAERAYVVMRPDPRESFAVLFTRSDSSVAVMSPVLFYPAGSLLAVPSHRESMMDYLVNCDVFPEEGAYLYGLPDWLEAISNRLDDKVLFFLEREFPKVKFSDITVNFKAPVEGMRGFYKDSTSPELSFGVKKVSRKEFGLIEQRAFELFARHMPFSCVSASEHKTGNYYRVSFLLNLE